MMSEEYSKLIRRSSTSRNMKPLEVWTCQRADNLKKSSKIPKITTQQQWYRRRADKLSAAAAAARRSTKVGGGGAHKLSAAAAARRGRRTALVRGPSNSAWAEKHN